MVKVDTSGWKEFNLTDIFRMNNTKSIVQKDVVPDSGTTPYVTAQAGNNGVMTYIDCPPEWVDEGNCIMIGGKTLTFSYQAKDFCSNDSHNIALHLKDTDKASEIRYLFLIVALRGALYKKYSWGDSISMKSIVGDSFRLPVDTSGEPNWAYMDEYMSAVLSKAEESLIHLRQANDDEQAVDVSEWCEFTIGHLFTVIKGTRLTKAHMTPGDIRFIGSSAMNNGCTATVGNTENMHPANTITVCYNGSVGETFYQDQPIIKPAVLLGRQAIHQPKGIVMSTNQKSREGVAHKAKTCFLYVRVSTKMQVENGESIEAQFYDLRAYAERENLRILHEYIDDGYSGKNITGCPYFQEMMEEIKSGFRVDYVLV